MPDERADQPGARTGSLTGSATLRLAMLSLENSPDCVYWLDVSGRIVYANAAAARTLGYSPDELARMTVADINPTYAAGSWGPDGTMFRALRDAGRRQYQTVHRHRDGREIPVEVSAAHMSIEGRHYIAQTVRDVSARVAVEADLRAAKETAEAATRAKSDFLARMSHEIRTPLNAIVGLGHLALRTQLTHNQRDYLSKLQSSAHALTDLVNNLLDFSKMEAGKLEIDRTAFRLEQLIHNVTSMVSLKAEEKGVALVARIDPEVPRHLLGDPLRLGQVLANLAANAVKFTERGEVSVSADLVSRDPLNARIAFGVTDTGIGITDKQMSRLFEPFSQADPSVSRKYGGTGLGLVICRQLVALMGGELSVESRAGQGSTFHFTLDLGIRPPGVLPDRHVPVELRGRRVLVVQGNEADRESLTAALTALSFDATAVDSGEAALDALAEPGRAFDVVFLDADVSSLGGVELVRRMRGDRRLGRAPRMVLTAASGRPELVRSVDRFGLDGLLIQPIAESDLLDTLMDLFGRAAAADAPTPAWAARASRAAASPFAGARVLLVEDNRINQRVAREILEALGIAVEMANDGRAAVDAVAGGPGRFDAVLMDMQMPVMDGCEATRVIRQRHADAPLPIIAVTANALSSEREACLAAGMNDYVSKPVDPARLEKVLDRWIGRGRRAPIHGAAPGGEPASASPPAGDLRPPHDLPAIDGVDVASALERLNGKQDLFLRLLRGFVRDHAGSPTAITDAIGRGELDVALATTHGLKGVAGTLSATDVFDAARDLEADLRGDRVRQVGPHLERLRRAFDVVAQSVASATDPSDGAGAHPAATAATSPASVAPLLADFDSLLRTRRFSARGQFESVRALLADRVPEGRLDEIQACLDRLDFAQARSLLAGVATHLGLSWATEEVPQP